MPEGDTIHKLATALAPALLGEKIYDVRVRSGPRVRIQGRPATGRDVAARLEGRRVGGIRAAGKYLLIDLAGGWMLRIHLGLYGSWHRYRPGEAWRKPERQASLVLRAGESLFVCFNAREIEYLQAAGFRRKDLQKRLGPDLLAPEPDWPGIIGRARARVPPGTSMADVLLDQTVAGGIGNVYKSEVLFLEGIDPATKVANVSDEELHRVYERARELMQRNLDGGPRVTRFVGDGRGPLWVYGRLGKACFRCGTRVTYARMGRGMRSTYWCADCQKAG